VSGTCTTPFKIFFCSGTVIKIARISCMTTWLGQIFPLCYEIKSIYLYGLTMWNKLNGVNENELHHVNYHGCQLLLVACIAVFHTNTSYADFFKVSLLFKLLENI
jgi:hypothetical protein